MVGEKDNRMKKQMTSRERVLVTLDHREPDKVPIDLGGTQVTTLTRLAHNNLRSYLKLEPDSNPWVADRMQDVVFLKEDIHQRYHTDFRPVQMKAPDGFIPREEENGYYDEFGIRWRKALYYNDIIERPLANCESISDLKRYKWPDPYDPGRVRGLRDEAERLFKETEYALVADFCCVGPFDGAGFLRGYEQFCVDLALDPKFAQALLDMITDNDIGFWDAYLSAVGDFVQVVAQTDDLGMQSRTYISPAMIRKHIKPCLKRIYDFVHSKTNAKVLMHSCGSIYDIIPDFIEVGVDILNPIQRSAAKMDITKLKQEFGKELTFWGGAIDVQQVFPSASLEEIEAEAKRAIEILAPGGGFVFATTHNIQPDVSPDRIEKLYQSALRFRDYPIN